MLLKEVQRQLSIVLGGDQFGFGWKVCQVSTAEQCLQENQVCTISEQNPNLNKLFANYQTKKKKEIQRVCISFVSINLQNVVWGVLNI